MKKRIIAAAVLICLLLSLCGCKKGETAPEAVPTQPEPTAEASVVMPENERASAFYFDDVLFVGDSISEGLRNFEEDNDVLGAAQFLTSVSLSATNALWDVSGRSVHPTWDGEKMKVEDAVPLSGAGKVYLMLGMNDIISVGVERSAANLETLCDRILANAPGTELFVQSVTPLANEGRTSGTRTLSNQTISQYNDLLEQLCLRRGWHYLNVAEALRGDNGYLRRDFCSDPDGMGMHLNYTGCAAWAEYLYTHTPTP